MADDGRSGRPGLALVAAPLVLLAAVVGAGVPHPAAAQGVPTAAPGTTTTLCRMTDPRLDEISGLAPSRRFPGILWLHNDSGDAARLYGIDSRTCAVRATLTLRGVRARDFEAVAAGVDPGGRPVLWVGDIGDNLDSWRRVRVYATPEPRRLGDSTVDVVPYSFTYAAGPVNAEALLADPRRARLWVVSKQLAAGDVWALPYPLQRNVTMVARKVGEERGLVTDGAVSTDGSRYVVRDYVGARVYAGLPPGRLLAELDLPVQPQGEAVAWAPDGRALLLAGERDDRLLRYELPRSAWTATALAGASRSTPASPAASAGSGGPPASSAGGAAAAAPVAGDRGTPAPPLLLGAGALVAGAVALMVAVARRYRF